MKGKLVIQYDSKCNRVDYQFEESLSYDKTSDYLVWITLPMGRKFNPTELKLGLNKYLLRKLNGKAYKRNFPERVEILQTAYSNDIDIFENCDTIELIGDDIISPDIIASFPTKKIVIRDKEHPLTLEEVEHLEQKYAGNSNIYIYTEENEAPISLQDYRITVEEISYIANKIKSYGLSPLEAAVYAYDYARDRLYVKESSNDSTDSRDLTKVLLGNEVVCVGYSRILNAILHKCGIISSLYNVRSVEEGHAILIARIKDKKYDIDGIYYFDPTRDRKLNESNDHFYGYKSFAITRGEALHFGYYEDESFGPMDIEEYKRVVETLKQQKAHYSYIPTVRLNICNILEFLEGNSIYNIAFDRRKIKLEETTDAIEKLNLVEKLLSTQIEPTKLLSAIARVRQIQYYENPNKFPYSKETIRSIGILSQPYFSCYPYAEEDLERMYQDNKDEYDRTKVGIDLVKVLKKVKAQKDK